MSVLAALPVLHCPWLELSILIPLLGGLWVSRQKDPDVARRQSAFVSGLTLACTLVAVLDYVGLNVSTAHDALDLSEMMFGQPLFGQPIFLIDRVTSPLLPLTALIYLLTAVATLRTKIRRFSFAWTLISESIVLATFSCQVPWLLISLLVAGIIPPYLEILRRGGSVRMFTFYMLLFVALLIIGWSFADPGRMQEDQALWAVLPLLGAVLIRAGIFPVHSWVPELFEQATFGTALLFVAPITAAYATVRLIIPICPVHVMETMGWVSLGTAIYAAGMALVQVDARRFFAYLFLSHSALVFVGLESETQLGVTGALCMWLSVSISLCGFGLTLRALEARRGRLKLDTFQGVYEHTPALAVCFLLTGLASVGFPATFGFMGSELLVDAAVEAFPLLGIAVVLAAAINGIAVVQAYFRLFTGTRYNSTVDLTIGRRERFAVLTLAAIIIGLGIFPQPIVRSRYEAAEQVLKSRYPIAMPVPAAGEAEPLLAQEVVREK
jgi:NADH-quinone oxidoreductase subunit M